MNKNTPFSWVVRFTVAPIWVEDGFSLDDDRALSMLAKEIGYGSSEELQAKVLEAPSPLQIARKQGYAPDDFRSGAVVRELQKGHGERGRVRHALIRARDLLNSVAFVSKEGDTRAALEAIQGALDEVDARQEFALSAAEAS